MCEEPFASAAPEVSALKGAAVDAALGWSWWQPPQESPEGWEPELDLEELLGRELQQLVGPALDTHLVLSARCRGVHSLPPHSDSCVRRMASRHHNMYPVIMPCLSNGKPSVYRSPTALPR